MTNTVVNSDVVIEAKFNEFVAHNALFTSVDIANAIKKDGPFIRNSTVADWLRSNALSLASNYTLTQITVCHGQYVANLYLPIGSDPDNYTDRDQVALAPNATQLQLGSSLPSSTATVVQGNGKIRVRCDSKFRLRIPANLVKQLGMYPGDTVDTQKILTNNKNLPDNLIVHKDGRISISRTCLAWGDGPVLAFIDKGNLCFEKP